MEFSCNLFGLPAHLDEVKRSEEHPSVRRRLVFNESEKSTDTTVKIERESDDYEHTLDNSELLPVYSTDPADVDFGMDVETDSDKIAKIFLMNIEGQIDLTINSNTVDRYTCLTYEKFIQEKNDQGLPFFIATWKNADQEMCFAEATNFLKRDDTPDFTIYKSSQIKNEFHFFAKKETLPHNHGLQRKRINASSTDWDNPTMRQNAHEISLYYGTKAANCLNDLKKRRNYLDKSDFWLERSKLPERKCSF